MDDSEWGTVSRKKKNKTKGITGNCAGDWKKYVNPQTVMLKRENSAADPGSPAALRGEKSTESPPAMALPPNTNHSGPLPNIDAGTLNGMSKEAIGELLYPMIEAQQPKLAGKITGMLLDGLDADELAPLLASSETLFEAISDALEVLIEADDTVPDNEKNIAHNSMMSNADNVARRQIRDQMSLEQLRDENSRLNSRITSATQEITILKEKLSVDHTVLLRALSLGGNSNESPQSQTPSTQAAVVERAHRNVKDAQSRAMAAEKKLQEVLKQQQKEKMSKLKKMKSQKNKSNQQADMEAEVIRLSEQRVVAAEQRAKDAEKKLEIVLQEKADAETVAANEADKMTKLKQQAKRNMSNPEKRVADAEAERDRIICEQEEQKVTVQRYYKQYTTQLKSFLAYKQELEAKLLKAEQATSLLKKKLAKSKIAIITSMQSESSLKAQLNAQKKKVSLLEAKLKA